MLSGKGLCDRLIIRPEESYRVWRIHEATFYATRQRIQSPTSERVASKLTMIIASRNEKAGQSTSIALF